MNPDNKKITKLKMLFFSLGLIGILIFIFFKRLTLDSAKIDSNKKQVLGAYVSSRGKASTRSVRGEVAVKNKIQEEKRRREIGSKLIAYGLESETKIYDLISISERKIKFGEDILVLDYFISKKEITGRDLYDRINGKLIYKKESTDDFLGIGIRDGKLGFISGEIILKGIDKKMLENLEREFNAQVVYSNSVQDINIIKIDDSFVFQNIISNSKLKKFAPKIDIVFNTMKPR